MTAVFEDDLGSLRQANAELQQRLDERTAERDEALAREAATAEVLQVINSSPGDLAPVFDALLGKALELCGAGFGILHTYDGERIQAAAHRGLSSAFSEFVAGLPPSGADPSGLLARFLGGERFVHFDAKEDEAYRADVPIARALVEIEGGRSLLAVPLRKDAALLGMIVIYHREVRGRAPGRQGLPEATRD